MSHPRLPNGPPGLKDLTERQVSLLQCFANGKEMKEMPEELGITPDSIKRQFVAIREKLQARTTAHAVAIAMRHYIID